MRKQWSNNARKERIRIVKFILENYGPKYARDFDDLILQWESIILANPYIANFEPLLQYKPQGYRSVHLNKINRLIYYISGDTICFVDIWDMRRNPDALMKGL